MKFQSFTLLYLWIILALPVQAQVVRKIQPPNAPNAPHFSNAQHKSMEALRGPVAMTPNPSKEKKNWDVMLSQHGVSHGSDVPKTVLDSIKSNLAPQKRLSDGKSDPSLSENGGAENSVVDPYVTLDFKGNTYNGWTPTDNSVAVSDDGYIVSVVNSSLMFATDDGTVLLEESFDSYLDFLNLTGSYFDPRVIYDPIEDKFIMVVLSGNSPSNSNVVIGFSTTSDPTDTWWFYVYDGDPTNTNKWFDFPSIGVSATEIFISGNLFTSNDVFDQVVIYEFEKARGFAGQNLGGWFWDDVRDADGNRDFTVVPISFGFDGAIGPGIFFISSNSGGGNEVMMYYTTDIGANNPTLEVFSASTAQYDVPINGYQLGSSDEIMTNDCRIQSGYWANGILHFVLNTAHTDLYTRIYYGRLNTDNLTVDARRFGLTEYEYAFPSVIPFTTDETDQTALIAFLRTGSAIYPQFRVVTCDNAGAFSGSVLVKGGEDYVDFSFDSQERWGDYSGISRRHLNNEVEVWVAGSYGAFFDGGDFNILSTWVARISDEDIAAPVANFVGNPTTVTAGQLVLFTDLSTNTPTTWAWSFPGGSPTTSVVKDPAIIYNTPGTYNVSLTASNSAGSDGETKTAYITVNPLVIAPVANFSANQTVITAGQSVQFTDLSTNTPTAWAWSFPGGTPVSSSVKNPLITYNTPGTYNVSLTASNSAGSDGETKIAYITVNPNVIAPVANFSANQTVITAGQSVQFTDLSTNGPTSWNWSFPGGTPTSSTQQNPTVTYNTPGTFNVSLTAGNSAGSDGETKTAYITVNPNVIAPVANFSANQTVITAGQSVQFTDLSTNGPTSWNWSFPGGTPTSSTQQNPTVTYNTPGTYNVSLTAGNSAGNDGETKTAYITVNPNVVAPVANFSANQTMITAGQSVQFTDLSTNNPTSWTWSFSGGTPNVSTLQNPTVTYNNPGTYTVTLVSSNTAGADDETKTAYITVNPNVIAPVANFSANQTVITAGQSVQFTDLSANNPTSWTWSFPGGTPNVSTVQNPNVTYNNPGTYTVTLVSINAAGADDETKTAYITVNPQAQAPVANFSANVTQVNVGGVVQFTDQSTNNPTSWTWSFPGGTPNVSTLQNPIIIYATAGVYPVTLVAGNAVGADDETKTNYITVGMVSTLESEGTFSRFEVFPNPVSHERLNLLFELEEKVELDFYIINSQGAVVKHLLRHRVKPGANQLAFNTELLSSGVYYILAQNPSKHVFKQAKFVVVD